QGQAMIHGISPGSSQAPQRNGNPQRSGGNPRGGNPQRAGGTSQRTGGTHQRGGNPQRDDIGNSARPQRGSGRRSGGGEVNGNVISHSEAARHQSSVQMDQAKPAGFWKKLRDSLPGLPS